MPPAAREKTKWSPRDLLGSVLATDLRNPLFRVLTELLEWKDMARLEIALVGDRELSGMLVEALGHWVFRSSYFDMDLSTHEDDGYGQEERREVAGGEEEPSDGRAVRKPAELEWLVRRRVKLERLSFKRNATGDISMHEAFMGAMNGDYGFCEALRHLQTLPGITGDKTMQVVSEDCKELQSLDLRSCRNITDAGMASLSEGCKELRLLNLDSCDKITDAGLASLSEGCKELRSLNLEYCRNVTFASLASLSKGCEVLR